MEVLYIAASGASDPTRASIPWHLAVNGSFEVGQRAGILLAGDAAEVIKASIRAELEGVGLPPLRDLIAKAHDNEIPVFV
jgi:predicted peroxiredoxin